MKQFNYNTVYCSTLGNVTPNNLKEFADKMVNYPCVASFRNGWVLATAFATRMNGYIKLQIRVNDKTETVAISGNRVSEGMGRRIYLAINDAINAENERLEKLNN